MRLIDADALYKKFLHLYETDKKATGANAYDLCAMLTEDAPTIDAVPVVRCKDCKHSTTFHHTGNMYCGLHENHHFLTDAYGFCHKGERRCDNGTEKERAKNLL